MTDAELIEHLLVMERALQQLAQSQIIVATEVARIAAFLEELQDGVEVPDPGPVDATDALQRDVLKKIERRQILQLVEKS